MGTGRHQLGSWLRMVSTAVDSARFRIAICHSAAQPTSRRSRCSLQMRTYLPLSCCTHAVDGIMAVLHSKKSLLGNLSVHVLESFPSITLVTILSYPHESSDLRVSGKILGLG